MDSNVAIYILLGAVVVSLLVVILMQQRKLFRAKDSGSPAQRPSEPPAPSGPTLAQKKQALMKLRRQLDSAVAEASNVVSTELYSNCVLPTVREWFEGSDSVQQLNDSIQTNLKKKWKSVEPKVRSRFALFAEETSSVLTDVSAAGMTFDSQALSNRISERLSIALGTISTTIVAVISGGGGVALIASGPIGIVIGAVVGAFAFFFGKKKLEDLIGSFLIDKSIPRIMKKPALSKVTAELKLKESQFKEDIEEKMQEMVKPVYEEIENELARLV